MDKLLLLDFDGVINALSSKGDKNVHPVWNKTELLGFPILYADRVVDFINSLSDHGVTVVWCTSWEEDSRLFTSLGFKSFPYVKSGVSDLHYKRLGTWKAEKGSAYAAEYTNVVWFDDDYYVKKEAKLPVTRPTPTVGVSKKLLRNAGLDFGFDLDLVNSWLD